MSPFRNFVIGKGAVIATEFALVAPILVIIWFGGVEASFIHLVARRVEVAAQSAANLVGQNPIITETEITDIGNAMNAILDPYPDLDTPATAGYNVSSIVADAGGTLSTGWERTGGLVAVPAADLVEVAALNLTTTDDSVIVVTLVYNYQPPVLGALIGSFTISETAYARPRLVPVIPEP